MEGSSTTSSVSSSSCTYYQLLNIDPFASAADLRRAYQKAALLLHPDKIILSCDGGIAEQKEVG